MSKTGVIVIEVPDPPTTDNASTDATAETQSSTDSDDGSSKPGKKDKATS